MDLTHKDLEEIKLHGLRVEDIENQLLNFIKGFPFVQLSSAAVIGDGIQRFDDKETEELIEYYQNKIKEYSIVKFVPASGAATRMFKDLFEFSALYVGLEYTLKDFPLVKEVIDNLPKFSFYQELKQSFESHSCDINEYIERGDYATVVNYILTEIGLNYGKKPKALILFHTYPGEERKHRFALEEHFVEAVHYAEEDSGNINLHFTISLEHKDEFEKIIKEIKPIYEKRFGVKYTIAFSLQKNSTDTIAVNSDNSIAYDKNGKLIFRPAGHGALIENLNDIQGDIIFIKNIDNISHDKIKSHTYKYKKLIAGVLLKTQSKIFSCLNALEKEILNSQDIVNIIEVCNSVGITLSESEKRNNNILKILYNKLNRPIRVCAMVKNEGEPGGGPFWVEKDGVKSLQIIEKAQVNILDEKQNEIFLSATHFNPVDLVCGVRNHKGEKFDLRDYIDEETGFISNKSKDGKVIKAQEKPGLWNGAMANWITIFVEVPLITFTPVKIINDLLRKEHQ